MNSPLTQLYRNLKPGEVIIPKHELIYRAFELTPMNQVKVVIIGQDPYPNPEDATGLAFSVPAHRPIPKSLGRILSTLNLSGYEYENGDLTPWTQKGVLLLNSDLTTIAGRRGAHKGKWKDTISCFLRSLYGKPIVWWLMGKQAQEYHEVINGGIVYCTDHPSPLSGSKFVKTPHFKIINEYLELLGHEKTNWSLR